MASTEEQSLRFAANILRTGSAHATGDGLETSLREAARFLDRLVAGATVEEAARTTPRVTDGTAGLVTSAEVGHGYRPPVSAVAREHGADEYHPSPAAGYGTETLMAMAGTLAERSEQAVPDTTPAQQVPGVDALGAVAYGMLALTQAVRDLPETLAPALAAALVAAIEEQEAAGQ
jgi:hypothetical protein